jgi:hypothetical protein
VRAHQAAQGDSTLLLLVVKEALEQFSLRFTAKDCGLRNTHGSVPMCESSQPPVGKHSNSFSVPPTPLQMMVVFVIIYISFLE